MHIILCLCATLLPNRDVQFSVLLSQPSLCIRPMPVTHLLSASANKAGVTSFFPYDNFHTFSVNSAFIYTFW